ncbi:MAG: hypothetical protein F6K47_38225 [Symploca sp. SIO2E6]|nr:hypothetical protein [Symploca sp. SIO2E6]
MRNKGTGNRQQGKKGDRKKTYIYSLLITYYSLLITHYSLLITYYLLLIHQ